MAKQTKIPKQVMTKLKQVFGFDQLYPTQQTAVKAVLDNQDCFVLMPTGGGKSLCFQLPALIKEGTAIVISPLISLMKDQVDGLKAYGVKAEFLNSSQTAQVQQLVVEQVVQGNVELLYISAERLQTISFQDLLSQIKVSLFAVDEAHCISQWGHDFRPDYTQLRFLKKEFPHTPIIALTATADVSTKIDIISQLELENPVIVTDSFDRPNIHLSVKPGKKRIQQIASFLEGKDGQSGILYCLTRKETEKLAEKITSLGYAAAHYHAGMSNAERDRVQQSFSRDKTQIVCATIAFGMGIDKLNVRWVIHYNLPKNVEGYYQEIGRAGRDGAPAEAVLFYSYADVERLKRFVIDKKQKSTQLAKLERIKSYAEAIRCRRQSLLHYFGEYLEEPCDNCDRCGQPVELGFPALSEVKTILSTIQKHHQKLDDKELVSTLRTMKWKASSAETHWFLAQLKNAGLIASLFSTNNVLTLTKKGAQWLANPKEFTLVSLDDVIKLHQSEATAVSTQRSTKQKTDIDKHYSDPLFQQLKNVRTELATNQDVPAFVIFSDTTLLEMVSQKPQTKASLLKISGVGKVKLERYGDEFLDVLQSA